MKDAQPGNEKNMLNITQTTAHRCFSPSQFLKQ